MEISKIDKNFKPAVIQDIDLVFCDTLQSPFVLEGLPFRKDGEILHRLPSDLTTVRSPGHLAELERHTTGAAIRFRTDSGKIAIRAILRDSCDMNHMTRTGSAGFDLYKDNVYCGSAQPSPGQELLELLVGSSDDGKMHDYLLNLPLYGGTDAIEIGLVPGSNLLPPTPHKIDKPILFYGSSITQGGCASRPGNMYSSFLCREVDAPQINLGFSGNALGDVEVARCIATLDLSLFVMDYDHNESCSADLQKYHYPFYKIIRDAHKELPIIMVSKCDFHPGTDDEARREVVRTSYNRAVAEGDKFVYFVDGETLFGPVHRDACTVDGCHPNDLGFYRMFENLLPAVKAALNIE